jgi:1-acyl-sn-glycerol-3-phosphate acyltransferase
MALLRKILAWTGVLLLCLLSMLLYLARPFNPDNNRILAGVCARFGRAVLGMQRPLSGAENMPIDRSMVVIANHQHNDDFLIVGDIVPRRVVAVGKVGLLWVPFFGQVFWLGGNVILNRSRSRKSVASMQAVGDTIVHERKTLWVFPEGTRSRGKGLQSFKKGAFYAAIASELPLVMVCVGQYQHESQGWLGRRKPVPLRILPAIETTGMTNKDIPELIARCHSAMGKAIAELGETKAQ